MTRTFRRVLPARLRPLLAATGISVLVAAGGATGAAAQDAPAPIARASVSPEGAVVVGQPVTVGIEVLVPTFFRGAPAYDDIELEGAISFFNERGTNFTERIDGQTWAGQRRSYTIYANRAGSYEVGPIPVEVRYGVGSGVVIDTAFAGRVRFTAEIPEAARGLPAFVAAAELRLDQLVDPAPDTIRVGESFTRTVTTEVEGTLSMIVPPLAFDSVEGLAVYPSPPRLEDAGGERGTAVVGRRVESASYVAMSEGDYELPAVTIAWWDWTRRGLRSAELPGVAFTVIANPDLATEIELPPDSLDAADDAAVDRAAAGIDDRLRRWGMWLLIATVLGYAGFRLLAPRLPAVRARLAERRNARAESEGAYFRRLRDAARSDDPRATAHALAAWLDHLDGVGRISDLIAATGDPLLAAELERLDGVLYGRDADAAVAWSGGTLLDHLTGAREQLLRRPSPSVGRHARTLGPLNPTPR